MICCHGNHHCLSAILDFTCYEKVKGSKTNGSIAVKFGMHTDTTISNKVTHRFVYFLSTFDFIEVLMMTGENNGENVFFSRKNT